MKELIKGKGAVGIAISFFSLRGMVSIPLEPCDYNLLFDDGIKIHKIKVISCSFKSPYGAYMVSIRTMGGNMPHLKAKVFDETSCDFVFVVTDALDMFNIPSDCITAKRQFSLNVYAEYRVILGDVV